MADQWVRSFTVTDPRTHFKGFTVYKVSSTVFPRKFPEAKTVIVVWKRFSEFQKLYKELKSRHEKLYLRDVFPSFSKPCLLGRFDSNVVEERRLAAQNFLNFIANHPPLFTSESCVKFFEKSHKVIEDVVMLKDTQDEQPSCTSVQPEDSVGFDIQDTFSDSSTQSAITDTDSAISISSYPSQSQVDESARFGNSSVSDGITNSLVSSKCIESGDILSTTSSIKENQDEHRGYALDSVSPKKNVDRASLLSSQFTQLESCPKPSTSCESSSVETNPTSVVIHQHSSIVKDSLDTATSESDSSQPSVVMDYITRAGFHVSQAVEHESLSQFECAFASYKAAISCLLSGVQDDPSEDRKLLVQRKASQYLIRAEQIYHDHLDTSHYSTRSIPRANDVPVDQMAVGARIGKSLQSPITDLKFYKVLGVVSNVILALNTQNDTPYIIKVLHKSPCPSDRRTKSIVPCNVPFMCRLNTFMENECAVFLILEQARGGRLWDHISPYFEIYNNQDSSKSTLLQFLSEGRSENNREELSGNKNCRTGTSDKTPADEAVDKLQDECITEKPRNPPQSGDYTDMPLLTGTQSEGEALSTVPVILVQEASSFEGGQSAQSNLVNVSNIFNYKEHSRESDCTSTVGKTADILRSSQKLLDSINNTLSESEEATKALLNSQIISSEGTFSDFQQEQKRLNGYNNNVKSDNQVFDSSKMRCLSKERQSIISRESRRSGSRDRNNSSTRRPRSRIQFSCDDMFEGRARALSRSLDREALNRAHPREEKGVCPGLPIDTVRLWACQLLLALDALHRWGVVIGDLRPDNLLLGRNLTMVITYQCQWICVDRVMHTDAIEQFYASPEVRNIQEFSAAADWWSYGAILFELLSGETLFSCHPGGLHSYTTLYIPSCVSEEGASLLRQLLQYDAQKRLGAGPHGVAKLKAHSFFKGIEWNKILLTSVSV